MLKSALPLNVSTNLAGEYVSRINKVIDYIELNLAKELAVEELASVAGFSPYHFHRLFSSLVGETLGRFIQRLRLEKSAYLITMFPRKSITEILLETGFSGTSVFSRAFKEYYGVSPSTYRQRSILSKTESKGSKQLSSLSEEFDVTSGYVSGVPYKQIWSVKMKNDPLIQTDVVIKEVPEFTVAYVRHIGPYKGDEQLFERLWNKLCGWAGPRDLLKSDTKFLTVYHDNPDVTEENNLRISVCISVPEDIPVEGEIGKMKIHGGKNAVGKFEIYPDKYPEAWNSMYAGWLPRSGYQPDERPCYELFLMDPKQHPEGKHLFEIYLPVKPL